MLRWARRWGGGRRPPHIWKLEFQRRGAPHFHILIAQPSGDLRTFRAWLSEAWAEVVGHTDAHQRELHRRAGTDNVAGIVGLQTALSLIDESSFSYMQELKEMLLGHLCKMGTLNGGGPTICNTINIAFSDVDAENLMIRLDQCGVCVSMGSACSSGSIEPSRILLEMGVERSKARSSLRFSLSRFNTKQEMEKVIQILQELLSASTFSTF